MKKLIGFCALFAFTVALVGCGGSPTSAPPPPVNKDKPKIDVPKADTPKADAPKLDLPKGDLPKLDVPKGDVPKLEIPKGDLPKTPEKTPEKKPN
jgi:hypothetical protein